MQKSAASAITRRECRRIAGCGRFDLNEAVRKRDRSGRWQSPPPQFVHYDHSRPQFSTCRFGCSPTPTLVVGRTTGRSITKTECNDLLEVFQGDGGVWSTLRTRRVSSPDLQNCAAHPDRTSNSGESKPPSTSRLSIPIVVR